MPSVGSDWQLDDYQKLFEAQLLAELKALGETDIDAAGVASTALTNALPPIAQILHNELARRSKSMLRGRRRLRRGFVKRNMRRWRDGFDLLERLIVISEETGSAINNALRLEAAKQNDARFEAIVSNHSRAVQVSREILALMVAGFPDGALGRWRTLHEIAVVSYFIAHADRDTAERYVLHHHVTAYKRAKNYMEHHERANLEPIGPEVIDKLKAAHDEVVRKYGPSILHDYGWASHALSKAKPTFADLEKTTGLDHWRPRYKWSTSNTHGAYRMIGNTLASCESETPVRLTGESNSGMTDPAHMTAISLNIATVPLATLEPNLDRLAATLVMQRLGDEIGETFWLLDQRTYARSRRVRKGWARLMGSLSLRQR